MSDVKLQRGHYNFHFLMYFIEFKQANSNLCHIYIVNFNSSMYILKSQLLYNNT